MKSLVVFLAVMLLVSCSDEAEQRSVPTKEHVWQDMTGTIEKAKDIDPLLEDAAARQRKAIEAATQ